MDNDSGEFAKPVRPKGSSDPKYPWSIRKQQFVLALCLFALLGLSAAALALIEIPKENVTVFSMLVSQLLVVLALVAKYYWPSSVSSEQKNDVISTLTSKVGDTEHKQ